MNKVKYFLILFCIISLIVACNTTRSNQQPATNSSYNKSTFDTGKWVFDASQALPQNGSIRYLDNTYNVIFNKGKLQVSLPYFGTADAGADVLSGKSPLDFTTTDFTMISQQNRSESWNVNIKLNDAKQVQSMNFTFFQDGSARLNVILTYRSPIRFNGNFSTSK